MSINAIKLFFFSTFYQFSFSLSSRTVSFNSLSMISETLFAILLFLKILTTLRASSFYCILNTPYLRLDPWVMLFLPLKLPLLLRFLNGRSSKLPLWGILTDGRSLPMLVFVLWNCFIYVGVFFVCECLVKRAVTAKLGQFFPGQSLRRLGTDFALYL